MKTLYKRTEALMAEAAMNEEGTSLGAATAEACDPFEETLQENLVEVAFAEAANYDDIHEAILREHRLHCATA